MGDSMGILDDIMGSLGGGVGGDVKGGNPLMNIVMQMLSSPDSGGLHGLMKVFMESGLKDQFASWVGTGSNMPVSADQISSIFGDKLGPIAKQLGISEQEAAGGLADMMPKIIDKLTPDGQIPEAGTLIPDGLMPEDDQPAK
jgi:uncharacterized protein YidB (DUF937 family)